MPGRRAGGGVKNTARGAATAPGPAQAAQGALRATPALNAAQAAQAAQGTLSAAPALNAAQAAQGTLSATPAPNAAQAAQGTLRATPALNAAQAAQGALNATQAAQGTLSALNATQAAQGTLSATPAPNAAQAAQGTLSAAPALDTLNAAQAAQGTLSATPALNAAHAAQGTLSAAPALDTLSAAPALDTLNAAQAAQGTLSAAPAPNAAQAAQAAQGTLSAAPGAASDAPDAWFLSFDCATKSFAFALLRVRPPGSRVLAAAERLAAASDAQAAAAALSDLDAETRACLHLAGCGAADLVPGVKDEDIPAVARVRAVLAYLRGPVAKALAAAAADGCPPGDSPQLHVAVEYQMGANSPARMVATVLVAHYAAANVFMVGPAFKNKLWFPSRPDLRVCHFIEKRKTLYAANKGHSRALYFEHLGPLFGHTAAAGIPVRLRKDFADSVAQVLGLLAFGDLAGAPDKF
jgi:hypothetical protein